MAADELRIDERPSLERPVLIAAFRGWNDGGQAATLAAGYLDAAVGRRAVRGHRPRGLRRLPVDAAARHARRGADAADRVAGERVLPRGDPGRGPRRGDAARRRAELPLAHVHRPDRRTRARARRRARRHARRAARRRAAHAAGARDGLGHRPAARRGARAPALALRGADRDRRRAPRRLPARRTCPSASLWSAVPHYVSLAPSPRAARALVRPARRRCSTVEIDITELARRRRRTPSR